MKAQALVSVHSQKIRQEEIVVLSELAISEAKTKMMAALCEKLNAGSKALFIFDGENVNLVRATKNLAEAATQEASLVNVYDLVRANKVFITKDAVRKIEEVIG